MPKKVSGGMEGLLSEELQDLMDAEKQLVRALPKMAKSATDEELERALRDHLEVTRGQVQRLEQVFESMDMRPRSRPCRGMKGIVEEGQEMLQEEHEESILDSAIAGSARKVEHYEMVAYESARALAQKLGRRDAAQLLEETMREEIDADKQLAQISKRLVKEAPAMGSEGGEMAEGRRGSRSSGRSSQRGGGAGNRGRQSSARGGRKTSGRSRRQSSGRKSEGGHSARPLMDHEEIQQWAEERGASPACVRGTGGRGDTGMIRLDFPGWGGEESLEHISWDEWFEKFDENNLALMVQDTTAGGETSNFNKLVKREHAGGKPRARSAH